MAKELSPAAKKVRNIVLGILIIGGAFLGYKKWVEAPHAVEASQSINKFQLGTTAENPSLKASQQLPIPTSNSTVNEGTQITWEVMAWNSQFPLMYANGGVNTVQGSLFAAAGVNVTIKRQDDCNQTIKDFLANAQQIKDNPQTVPVFMSFMGDGVPGFTTAFLDLKKLGADYQPVAFYAMGRSNGEDGFWGPKEWKQNPKNALGHTVAGVERDGDVNIVLKWASDNDIPVNANTKVFDLNAINILPAADFIDAGKKFISGYTETRKIAVNGKTTGKDTVVGTDSYTSWTPVDVTVAQQKGGVIRLASTKEYTSQMPNITLVLKSWANAHMDVMKKIILALGQAGDQVKSFPDAQQYAAKVSATVYADGDHDAAYWLKYWKGVTENDATGAKVQLGGSSAFNLADAANTFGLGPDGLDRYKITYETFGNILAKLYPDNMKGWQPYATIIDKDFLRNALADAKDNTNIVQGTAEEEKYTNDVTTAVSSAHYNIQFEVNASIIKPGQEAILKKIVSSAVIASGLTLQLTGHTDISGDHDANTKLSLARAQSVRDALVRLGLPAKQIADPKGVGPDELLPNVPNNDPSNRYVEVILGN